VSYDLPEGPHRSSSPLEVATLMLGPPVAWGLHLLLIYLVVTIDCETGWGGSSWVVYLLTAAAAAVSVWAGVVAWRRWRAVDVERAEQLDPQSPRPFIHLFAMAGALLFTTAIVLTGLTPLFVPTC